MTEQLSLDWTLDRDEARVLCALSAHRGRERAVGCKALARLVGLNPRDLQQVVHRLRVHHGAAIASTASPPAGYYLVTTSEELERCYREHRAKALSTLAAMAALRRIHLRELLGQLALEIAA